MVKESDYGFLLYTSRLRLKIPIAHAQPSAMSTQNFTEREKYGMQQSTKSLKLSDNVTAGTSLKAVMKDQDACDVNAKGIFLHDMNDLAVPLLLIKQLPWKLSSQRFRCFGKMQVTQPCY